MDKPGKAWQWLGDYDAALDSLPATTHQVPSRLNVIVLGFLSIVCIGVTLISGYMALASGKGEDLIMLGIMLPIGAVGAALIYFVRRQSGSGRTVQFEQDGVSVDGKWFGKAEKWTAPYSAFQGVGWRTERVNTKNGMREFGLVELRHRDREKSIPLYVSVPLLSFVNEDELAAKCQTYAQRLGVPVLG